MKHGTFKKHIFPIRKVVEFYICHGSFTGGAVVGCYTGMAFCLMFKPKFSFVCLFKVIFHLLP